jgi:hypothetical protein
MNWKFKNLFSFPAFKKTTILFLGVVFFFVSAFEVSAQRKFSKTYPASKNVRLQLLNRTGTVEVEGWDRAEVKITADVESSATVIEPQNLSGTIYINLVKDNQGRNDVGYANFKIKVPYSSSVDIETRMGNLVVNNIGGVLVRAHISSEGDITLTNISANNVDAGNLIGNIFFDGEIRTNGIYRFTSTRSDINLRIPLNSSFRLVATAPSSRNISLGPFSGDGNMRFLGDGRRVIGQASEGSSSLTVTTQRGSISFIRR